jgi:hypothetical protein
MYINWGPAPKPPAKTPRPPSVPPEMCSLGKKYNKIYGFYRIRGAKTLGPPSVPIGTAAGLGNITPCKHHSLN